MPSPLATTVSGALFHVDHLDGDEEDLEDYEVTDAHPACNPMCSSLLLYVL